MNRNSVIGLIIIFAVLVAYSWWMTPSKEELEKSRRKHDSISRIQRAMADSAKVEQAKLVVAKAADTINNEVTDSITRVVEDAPDKYGDFAASSTGTEKNIILENDLLRIKISNKGGGIRSVQLKEFKSYDQQPLILFKADSAITSFSFFSNNRLLNTADLYFEPVIPARGLIMGDTVRISGNDSVTLLMRLYPGKTDSAIQKNKYIEFRYTLKGNDYMTGFGMKLMGMKETMGANADYLTLEYNARLRQQEKSLDNEKLASTVYYKYYQEDVDYLSERKDDEKSIKTKLNWISFKQQFFTSTLIAPGGFSTAILKTSSGGKGERYLKSMSATIGIPLNINADVNDVPMNFYFGPNKYKIYRQYHLDLERQIPLGWSFFLLGWINKYAVIPVFDFLSGFNLNYGIIILILTLLLKLVLFPIGYKTYISSARMRVLKPEVDEINKKYPKKEDALKKQQATMEMYKRAGVNPMSGCLPLLLQMPILIAFFRFFPASIELRQQSFLWAEDLSAYDSILDLPFSIPFYGDHVSLFTLLMTISTIIYTKLSNDMMSSGTQQMPGMKTMMYLMPIMFLGFFNSYSSGLSYYYLLANLFTFLQMFLFRKFVNEDKIHAKIQANKKKPVKKSSFQKRLEEMASKKGYPSKR